MNLDEIFEQLDQAVQAGTPTPLHFCAISENGSILAGHYETDGSHRRIEAVTEHILDGDFAMPVQIMFVATGFVARFTFKDEGTENE